jgi:hypothetical protein
MTTATTSSNAAAAALLGAIVGDAAAQTSHWNYDRKVFHAKLRSAQRYDTPEFFPCNSYYNVTPGGSSCYGDQLIAVAKYLTTIDTCNDDDDDENDPLLRVVSAISNLVNLFEKKFNGASIYGPWPIVNQPEKPLSGPWRHGSIKDLLTNLQKGERGIPNCGSNADSQADCFVKAIPVVCMYAGHPAMLECVEIIDTAVAYATMAARVLESCILGTAKDVQTAIQLAVSSLSSSSSLTVTDEGKLEEAKLAFELVLETCHMEPPTYEMGVNYLGSHKLMKSYLTNPVSLVA